MDKKTIQIFVTGGTGFIGSYLLRYLLQEGYLHIRALKRAGSNMSMVEDIASHVEWVEGDILDAGFLEEVMEGVEVVFHSAGFVSYDPRDRKVMKQVNADGTANLVNVSLEKGVRKFIHVSSIAALGRPFENQPIDEGFKWDRSSLNSWYAITKFQAEMEVWRGLEEGLPAVIVNPSVVLGSGDWKGSGSSRIFHVIGKGFPFYPPGSMGFVDVRDVARFMVLLLERDILGQRYILNAGNWTYKELFSTVCATLQQKPPRFLLRSWMGGLAWRAEKIRALLLGRRAVITRETVGNTLHHWKFANEKSTALGFSYLPLSRTIEETVLQWKETRGEKPAVLPFSR